MMGWQGRQEDPEIRKAMTEELSRLFAKWGWDFTVCAPAIPREVLLEPPIWYAKRQLDKENPGKYRPGKAKGINFDHISPVLEITIKKSDMAARKMVRREGLSLPVFRKGGGRVKEVSLAFAVGENLDPWARGWIATQESDEMKAGEFDDLQDTISPSTVKNPALRVPGMKMGTSMATPVGLFPFLCLLMAIKRLWVPGLGVWGAEGCGWTEWADRQRLFIRPASDALEMLRSDALHHAFVKLFPGFPGLDWELWEKKSDFRSRTKGRAALDWGDLATMMDRKFPLVQWREATVQALVDLDSGLGEDLMSMGIRNLGGLVEHGMRMGAGARSWLYDDEVLGYYARVFWFLADEKSGVGKENLLYRIPPPSPAPDEVTNAAKPRLQASGNKGEVPSRPLRFNPPEEVQALREEVIRKAVSADPGSLVALFRVLVEVGHLSGHRGVVHADALAVEVGPDLLLLLPVWEILPRLPLFRRYLGSVSPDDPSLVRLFRDLFEAAETLDRDVSSRKGTRKWLRDSIDGSSMSDWRMKHEFLYRKMEGGGHSGLPWKIVPAIDRFIGNWARRTRLLVAPLCDSLKDWLPSRAADVLEACGMSRLADLAERNKERLADHIKEEEDRSFTIAAYNDLIEKSPAVGCLSNRLGLRFNLMGPEEAGPYWPLAHSMAVSLACCMNCLHNRLGTNEGEWSCSLRSRRIEKEHEEVCLHFIEDSMTKKPGRPFKEIAGPVYRLLPGGPVGFRPLP